MLYVIQKLGWDVKSILLKFPSDQTTSLKIINEKQGSTAGENSKIPVHSSLYKMNSLLLALRKH